MTEVSDAKVGQAVQVAVMFARLDTPVTASLSVEVTKRLLKERLVLLRSLGGLTQDEENALRARVEGTADATASPPIRNAKSGSTRPRRRCATGRALGVAERGAARARYAATARALPDCPRELRAVSTRGAGSTPLGVCISAASATSAARLRTTATSTTPSSASCTGSTRPFA